MTTLSQLLLSTALFQGMSSSDLHEIVGNTRFDFRKYDTGKLVLKSDGYCTDLVLLLRGTVEVTTTSADHHYTVTENIAGTCLIEPERIFGVYQHYGSEYRTSGECQFLFISKQEVTRLLSTYEIFRINYINYISSALHRRQKQQWSPTPSDLEDRIMHFFVCHSLFAAGDKVFKIKMNDLAHELNDSRLDVSRALNRLQEKGRIVLSRGKIKVLSGGGSHTP